MHYFVDGYNLLFRVLRQDGNLQIQRQLIIHDLNIKMQLLHLDITIVFDATYQFGESRRSHFDCLEIIYTAKGETADDYILNALTSSSQPTQETVVTSDKKLAASARQRLAKTETVETFIALINQRFHNKKQLTKKPSKSPSIKHPLPSIHTAAKTEPSVQTSIEECFQYYLEIFEKQFDESSKSTKGPSKVRSRKANLTQNTESASNMQRWLKIFEDTFREDNST